MNEIAEQIGLLLEQKASVHPDIIRKKICEFEEFLNQQEDAIHGSVYGNYGGEVEHEFGDGLYIRKITMLKGMLLTSKIHKYRHPYFVQSGECSVINPEKVIRIKAPYWGMTEPLTKRILYIHEETIWITVHATKRKDLEKIEEQIILPNFDNVLSYDMEEILCLSGQ